MLNLDKFKQKKADCASAIMAAAKEQNAEAMEKALGDYAQYLGEALAAEAEQHNGAAMDAVILASRGMRQLTQQETNFYQEFIAAAKSADPKQAITNLTEDIPVTLVDAVLEDVRKEHKLLELIDFKNSSWFSKYVYNKTGKPTIAWGDITSAITNELEAELGVIDSTLYKLSAFIYVPMDILDLGPAWIDRFVRELLAEYLSAGLEDAVVDGDGNKKYIGMTRDVSNNVTVTGGVYPRKTAVVLNKMTATNIGKILAKVAVGVDGEARKVENPIMLVNPFDYFEKVMPATTVRAADGTYRNDVLPYPMEIIQTAALTEGLAVIGLPKKYLALIGMSKNGKLEYSDEYKFLEDLRTYKMKFFGAGRAIDDNAFVLCDISDLEPEDLQVVVKNADKLEVTVNNTDENPVPTQEVEPSAGE